MGIILSGGLVLTALYGLLALGFVVVYRATGVLNFAHGAFMVLGGYVGFSFAKSGLNGLIVVPLVVVVGFACGWLFYRLVMRRMIGQPLWAPVLVTVAFGFFVIPAMIQVGWTTQIRAFEGNLGFRNASHTFGGGVVLTTLEVMLVVAFVLCFVGLLAFYSLSRLGIQMRAAAQDQRLASYRAINVDLMAGLAWGIATGIVMFVGFTYSTNYRLEVGIAVLALKAFPAAMAGGMDSISGVLFGAVLIGFGETIVQLHVDTLLAEAVPFLVLFAVLLVRPWGLRGTPEILDRV
jgi:branched-chain amino acid transport system permease protein